MSLQGILLQIANSTSPQTAFFVARFFSPTLSYDHPSEYIHWGQPLLFPDSIIYWYVTRTLSLSPRHPSLGYISFFTHILPLLLQPPERRWCFQCDLVCHEEPVFQGHYWNKNTFLLFLVLFSKLEAPWPSGKRYHPGSHSYLWLLSPSVKLFY